MGKSISTSLEDDESDLIRTAKTPGQSPPNKPQQKSRLKTATPGKNQTLRRQQTQERPPSSIFKANPLILTCGYLRDIIKINKIPNIIYELCCNYYSVKYKSLSLDSNNLNKKTLIINKIDDQSFDDIVLGHDTKILGKTPIIKLSSSKHLKMDWNSYIKMDQTITTKNGTIVLTVFGDINMGKNTKLLCEGDGNIYIQCNNLIMRSGSYITTTSIDNNNDINDKYKYIDQYDKYSKYATVNSKSDLKRFGNIYMIIRKSLIMDNLSMITSGNIKIECQQIKIGMKSTIRALRKNLDIHAINGIISDDQLNEALYAKKHKKIHNENELNNNITKIKETMKENVSYKLTMFEGDSDAEFECCICWNNEPNLMIKPCGHSTFCQQCIKELNPIECPICRITIVDTKRF